MCTGAHRSQDGPRAGVTGDYEPPDVVAGN